MTVRVRSGERTLTQEELTRRCAKAASGLSGLGVGAGDAVALMLRNDFAFIEASIAARNVGAHSVPINWHLQSEEIHYILTDSQAKVFVVHEDILRRIEDGIPDGVEVIAVAAAPEIAAAYNLDAGQCTPPEGRRVWNEWLEDFDLWDQEPPQEGGSMIYTSGTTGKPKGVRRKPGTQENGFALMQAIMKVFGVEHRMRTIIPAPLYHSAPNAYTFITLFVEGLVVLQPRFDPEQFLNLIQEHKITHLQVAPTMFVRLLKLPEETRARYDLSSLKHVVHTAAPCSVELKAAMMDWWGPIINEYYGSTELGTITHCKPQDAIDYPGTVGPPVDGATIRILDEDDHELPPGEVGTIYSRLHNMPDFTYHGDEEKRRSVERDGLITCGDMGYLNEEGYLFISDRSIDMVISGGVNIYPAEIEAVLIQMPGVHDGGVFGIPDDEFGEALAAAVQLEPGVTLEAEEIQAYLRDRIAHYKVPKVIVFHDELPREDTGKLFKRRLRDPYWADAGRSI